MSRFGLRVLLSNYFGRIYSYNLPIINYRLIRPFIGLRICIIADNVSYKFHTYLGNKLHGDQFTIIWDLTHFERYRFDTLEIRLVENHDLTEIYYPEFIQRNNTYQYKSLLAVKDTAWIVFRIGSRRKLFLIDTEIEESGCRAVGGMLYIIKIFTDTGMIPEEYKHMVLQDLSQQSIWLKRIEKRNKESHVTGWSMDEFNEAFAEIQEGQVNQEN